MYVSPVGLSGSEAVLRHHHDLEEPLHSVLSTFAGLYGLGFRPCDSFMTGVT